MIDVNSELYKKFCKAVSMRAKIELAAHDFIDEFYTIEEQEELEKYFRNPKDNSWIGIVHQKATDISNELFHKLGEVSDVSKG